MSGDLRPIADQTQDMTWICPTCGKRPWKHAEFCGCGAARPVPAPPEAPTDLIRPDLPDISGAPWRLPVPRVGAPLRAVAPPRVVARPPRAWVP